MRFPSGIVRGNEAVIDGTLATLAEFPDRQLLAEDVIWSGDEDEGFLSSHRLVTSGTHTGHGVFGPPTGRASPSASSPTAPPRTTSSTTSG